MKFLFITSFLLFSIYSFSQCPNNFKNCKGQCALFIDENKDGYCDYSAIANKTDTIIRKQENSIDKIKQKKTNASGGKFKTECPFLKNKPCKEKLTYDTAVRESKDIISAQNDTAGNNSAVVPKDANSIKPPASTSPYHSLSISASLIVLYVVSLLLVRKNKIKKITHAKIWNAVLLIAFLFAGLIGLFLALKINYGFNVSFLKQLYIIHVDIAVGFTIIAFIHAWKHRNFFYRIIFREKEKC